MVVPPGPPAPVGSCTQRILLLMGQRPGRTASCGHQLLSQRRHRGAVPSYPPFFRPHTEPRSPEMWPRVPVNRLPVGAVRTGFSYQYCRLSEALLPTLADVTRVECRSSLSIVQIRSPRILVVERWSFDLVRFRAPKAPPLERSIEVRVESRWRPAPTLEDRPGAIFSAWDLDLHGHVEKVGLRLRALVGSSACYGGIADVVCISRENERPSVRQVCRRAPSAVRCAVALMRATTRGRAVASGKHRATRAGLGRPRGQGRCAVSPSSSAAARPLPAAPRHNGRGPRRV